MFSLVTVFSPGLLVILISLYGCVSKPAEPAPEPSYPDYVISQMTSPLVCFTLWNSDTHGKVHLVQFSARYVSYLYSGQHGVAEYRGGFSIEAKPGKTVKCQSFPALHSNLIIQQEMKLADVRVIAMSAQDMSQNVEQLKRYMSDQQKRYTFCERTCSNLEIFRSTEKCVQSCMGE